MINLWVIKKTTNWPCYILKNMVLLLHWSPTEILQDFYFFVVKLWQFMGESWNMWGYLLTAILDPSGLMSTWHVTARKQHCDQWQVAPGLPHLHHCPFVNSVTVQLNALGALGMDFTVNSILQLLILSKPLCFWHLEKFRSFIASNYTNTCVYLWEVRASLVAQLLKNSPAMQETPIWFLGQEDPLHKG